MGILLYCTFENKISFSCSFLLMQPCVFSFCVVNFVSNFYVKFLFVSLVIQSKDTFTFS